MAKSETNRKLKKLSLPDLTQDNADDITTHLDRAEYFLRRNMGKEIIGVLESFQDRYPFSDTNQQRLFDRLLGFGYSSAGRLQEAEDICLRGLQEEPDGLDYLFLLCRIRLSLREYHQALEYGQRFLAVYDSGAGELQDFTRSANYQSQLYNFLGSAFVGKSEWDKAREQFDMSRCLDSGNHLPYINLARLARHRGDLTATNEIIREGISRCRQIQELKLLANDLRNSATISACIVVKAEVELLEGCLESIRSWVEEIVLVDTGSTDRTTEIAQAYGARVFHKPWEGNLSGHRNYLLEQATGDWIFIIDADERFVADDVAQIRRLVNQRDIDIISVNVANVYGETEELTTIMPSVRFWRRKVSLRFDNAQQDQLSLSRAASVVRSGARIKHLGYHLTPDTKVS